MGVHLGVCVILGDLKIQIIQSINKITPVRPGLELNFNIKQQKANNISRAETSHEGLELAISETEPSPPTGGTISLKIEPCPRDYLLVRTSSDWAIKGLKVRLPKIYIAIFPNTVFRFIGITKSW